MRTIGAMLPSTRLESFIDKAFGDQPWSPEVVDGLKALLAEVKAQIGKVSPAVSPARIYGPNNATQMCKKIVNSIATGESLQRPKGFTLSKFIVNGYDKLDNDKCRRRLQRGDIVVYFDSFAVVVKVSSLAYPRRLLTSLLRRTLKTAPKTNLSLASKGSNHSSVSPVAETLIPTSPFRLAVRRLSLSACPTPKQTHSKPSHRS